MGGHPWFYCVPYEKDLAKCLQKLREREFAAGRYNPAERFPTFPVDLAHVPGCKHISEDAARSAAGANGTRSILDILRISRKPDFGAVTPLDDDELTDFYGTTKPTLADIEENAEIFDEVERGQGISLIVHSDGEPSHIYFYGYSYD